MNNSFLLYGAVAMTLFVAGCQTPGENLQSNVYQAGQVNSVQEARVIRILAVMPAKVQVDNSQNRQAAEIIGGILGALGGAAIGHNNSSDRGTGLAVGAAGGAVGGAALGSMVSDKILVDGVSITYSYKKKTLNSAQVGKMCEFKPGKAVMISTSATETRIQANAVCPESKSKETK